MNMNARFIFPVLMCLTLSAHGFGLSDHKAVLDQAFKEYNQCASQKLTDWQRFVIEKADLEEDVNLARKDLFFSHFYNPYKHLNMSRYDSSVRVQRLQDDLLKSSDAKSPTDLKNLVALGHIVHHLQDMPVPPHVVPVMHSSFTDGFESYRVEGEFSSNWSCDTWMNSFPMSDPETVLRDTAIQTLNTLANVRFSIRANYLSSDTAVLVSGDDFWRVSSNNDFGQYGFLGNKFGQEKFVDKGITYFVPKAFYQDFKKGQMRLAVQSTLLALRWYSLRAAANPPGSFQL